MTLPAAAPAIGGGIVAILLDRCWADATSTWSDRVRECRNSNEGGRAGLCPDHAREILGEHN